MTSLQLCIDARMIHAVGIGTFLKGVLPTLTQRFRCALLGDPQQLTPYISSSTEIIPCTIPIYALAEQWKIPLRVPSCKLFWTPHFNAPLLPVRAQLRMMTLHDVFHLAFYSTLPLLQRAYARLVLPRVVALADQLVTVSLFSQREICHYLHKDPANVAVIYEGIDQKRFTPSDIGPAHLALRAQHQLSPSFVLAVGSIKPHKNLGTLLKAFAQLPPAFNDYQLVIVGKKEGLLTQDHQIDQLLQANPTLAGRIKFTGYIPDEQVPLLYQMASLFVFPSFYEGFGFPPLEAMASGCPVMCSQAASLPEACGRAPYYFPPHQVEALRDGMVELLSSPPARAQLREAGLKQAARYSWEGTCENYSALISRLID